MVIEVLTTISSILADDPVPQDNDVVAGPWGAVIFVALIASVVFLLFSFTKQLRKVRAAKEAGVYGDEPVADGDDHADDGSSDTAARTGESDGSSST